MPAQEPADSGLSPDGAFKFVQSPAADVAAGKPAFSIIEQAAGRSVWSIPDNLTSAGHREARIRWSPNSKRFALESRTEPGWLGCFLFEWDGRTFIRQDWHQTVRMEDYLETSIAAAKKSRGLGQGAAEAEKIRDEVRPERWLGSDSLIVVRSAERRYAQGKKEAVLSATARMIVAWDEDAGVFVTSRELTSDEQPEPPDARTSAVERLIKRLQAQLERTSACQTLQQMWHDRRGGRPVSHAVILKVEQGLEVVTESREDDGYYSAPDACAYTQHDFHLYRGAVYALRVTRHDPCLDGTSHRIAQSWVLFDGGTPIRRSTVTIRLPKDQSPDDIFSFDGASSERESSPPPGYENWGARLTAHAYALARRCRSGFGGDTIGDWDNVLLKGAPPAGTGHLPPRTKDWLPPAGTLVLPVHQSGSPDGMFSIGWGYEKGPVDWKKLAMAEDAGWDTPVTFSTKLAEGPLPKQLEEDGNFLLNHVSGQPIAKLGFHYPGERQRFNHDELIARWSPSSDCVVVLCTQKWFTEYGHIAWIKNGQCTGSQDILPPLRKAADEAVLKSKHPAAKRLRGEEREGFEFTLSDILVEDDGTFEAAVVGQIPKDEEPGGHYEAIITGTFTPGKNDGPALLKLKKAIVKPYKPIE